MILKTIDSVEAFLLNKKLPLFTAFFIFAGFVLLHPSLFFFGVTYDTDASWVVAISEVVNKNLTFGTEVIYPYGPLGYLIARGINIPSVTLCILFDFLLVLNFVYALYYLIIIQKRNALLVAVCFFISSWTIGSLNGPGNNFVLLFFELFYAFIFLSNRKTQYLLLSIAISTLIFFIKANLGIISLFLITLLIVHQVVTKQMSLWKFLVIIFGTSVSIFWLGYLLNTDITSYFTNSLYIINTYNDALYYEPYTRVWLSFFVDSAITGVFLILSIKEYLKKKNITEFFKSNEFILFLFVMAYVYVLFKQSFVRADDHAAIFSHWITSLLLLFYGFSSYLNLKRLNSLFVIGVFCASVSLLQIFSYMSRPQGLKIKSPLKTIPRYYQQIANFNPDQNIKRPSPKLDFTKPILEKIGNYTVDAFPIEVSYIIKNKLNYHPRPFLQTSTSDYLTNFNRDFYESEQKPDFVLYESRSIDDRYPFFDETKTQLSLIKNYEVDSKVKKDLLLLKKRKSPLTISTEKSNEEVYRLGDKILIKNYDQIQFSRIEIDYNLWGKLRRFLFQPPALYVKIGLEGGKEIESKAIITNLSSGVILNHYVSSVDDFTKYLSSKSIDYKKIKYVQFYSNHSLGGVKSKIKVRNEFLSVM